MKDIIFPFPAPLSQLTPKESLQKFYDWNVTFRRITHTKKSYRDYVAMPSPTLLYIKRTGILDLWAKKNKKVRRLKWKIGKKSHSVNKKHQKSSLIKCKALHLNLIKVTVNKLMIHITSRLTFIIYFNYRKIFKNY